MYIPEPFSVADTAELVALMRARPFAALISAGPTGLNATHLPTVLGIRFAIARLEGKCKMSQNRDADDRADVIRGLRVRDTADDVALADLVERVDRVQS